MVDDQDKPVYSLLGVQPNIFHLILTDLTFTSGCFLIIAGRFVVPFGRFLIPPGRFIVVFHSFFSQ